MTLTIVKNYLTKNDCYNSGRRITPIGMQLHTIGTAQNTASSLASYWNQSGIEACVHYCVDAEIEGKVLQFLPDNYRSWGDGGFGNNNLITVELMESDYMKYTGGANYVIINEAKFKADLTRAYNTAVEFFAKKCTEYGWDPTAKLPNGLYVVSSHDEGRRLGVSTAHVDPTHVWPKIGKTMDQFRADVKAKMNGGSISVTTPQWYRVRLTWDNADSQLGAYEVLENAKNNCLAGYSVFDESGKAVYTAPKPEGTQASEFANLTEAQAAAKILEMAREDYKKTGVLASLTAAQMILESGYVKTELAKKANNCFGMKTTLSGNTWPNSTWDGKSKVNIRTAEEYTAGNITYIYADFRKYPCIEDSIGDHSAYLLGAKNGSALRYGSLVGCTDYKQAATIVKSGGYATDSQYVSKLCNIIERFGLNKYDKNTDVEDGTSSPTTPSTPIQETKYYRVGTGWTNGKCQNQVGAYEIKNNAIKTADSARDENKKTYYVFDDDGKIVYTAEYKAPAGSVQYKVQCGSFSIKFNAEKLQKQVKAKGFDAIIKLEDGQYKVQCGSFSIKSNAEKLRDQLKAKGFDVIIKEYADTSSDTGVSNFIDVSKNLADIMISEGWTYSNSNNKMNFDDARKASKPVSNCALFASHCLQKAGYMNKNQTFYFKESGAVVSRQKGWERLQETCKVTVYKGVSLSKVDLQAGDVVCYNGHVNTFLGYDGNKKTWLDAGRGGTKDVKEGSPFTNKMYKTGNMDGYKVYAVVRPL